MAHHETSLIFEKFKSLQAVIKIVDKQGLIKQMQDSYGVEVIQFDYEKISVVDLYRQFTNNINPPINLNNAQANVSISDTAAELARQINIEFGAGLKRNMLINLLKLVEANACLDKITTLSTQSNNLGLKCHDLDRIKSRCGQNLPLIVDETEAEKLLDQLKRFL